MSAPYTFFGSQQKLPYNSPKESLLYHVTHYIDQPQIIAMITDNDNSVASNVNGLTGINYIRHHILVDEVDEIMDNLTDGY